MRSLPAASLWRGALRHLFILAAPALSACAALPSTLDVSSIMHMHPTQDYCASRGLTLDATTKQCVTPPPASPPATAPAAGAPPHAAQAQPQQQPSPAITGSIQPQQQQQRLAPTVPIDPDAVIYPEIKQDFDLMSQLAHYVRATGYRCDSISALRPLLASHGYKMICNRFTFKYNIEEKEGRWTVTLD